MSQAEADTRVDFGCAGELGSAFLILDHWVGSAQSCKSDSRSN